MFHVPAQHQTSPIALPAQIHWPLSPDEREQAQREVDRDLWQEHRDEEADLFGDYDEE